MAAIEDQARPAVSELLQYDIEAIYAQLGATTQAMESNPSISSSFAPGVTYQAETMGLLEDLQNEGKRFFNRWVGQVYELMCGTGEDYKEERQKLQGVLDKGIDTVATVLAGVLFTRGGLAPALATGVAALAMKLFYNAAYETMCDTWKGKLPQNS
jgi:hypothetical protein